MPRPGEERSRGRRAGGPRAKYVLAKEVPKRRPAARQEVLQTKEEDKGKAVKFERETYKAPPGYDSKRMQVFRRYLDSTGVERNFKKTLRILIDRPDIPYNPYPKFVEGFTMESERFYMTQDNEHKITELLSKSLHRTSHPYLCCVDGSDFGWGLPNIVRATSPQHLQRYKWMVESLTPDDLYSQNGYTDQVMIGLTGPAVFEGVFYPGTSTIELRMDHLVTGVDMEKGIKVYAESVMAFIDRMAVSTSKHYMLEIRIPKYTVPERTTTDKDVTPVYAEDDSEEEYYDDEDEDEKEKKKAEKEEEKVDLENKNNYKMVNTWSVSRAQDERAIFIQAVCDATLDRKNIYADCVLCLDYKNQRYTTGYLQFSLTFLQVAENGKEEKITHFSEVPMATLHMGVFMRRLHAEQYLSTFADPNPEKSEASTRYTLKMPVKVLNNKKPDPKPARQQHRVQTDGFRFTDDDVYGTATAGAVRKYLERRLAGCHIHAEVIETTHNALLLYLMDREMPLKDKYVEIYNLLGHMCGRLYIIIDQLKNLQGIVEGISNSPNIPVIRQYLTACRDSVVAVFDPMVQTRNTEQVAVGKSLQAHIQDLITDRDVKLLSVLNVYSMKKAIGELRWYCVTLLQSLAGGCLFHCPALYNLINSVRATHPDAASGSRIVQRQKPDAIGFSIEPKVTHGMENTNLANLRHEKLVVNLESSIANSTNAPKSIAVEGVLLQYMLDTHLDNTWQNYLTELITAPYFPSNPYPGLVSLFRQQAMKMDLFFITEREVIKPLFASEVTIDDPDNFIYTISGVDCYGALSAIQVLDTATFMPLSQSLQPFFTENFTMKKGPFKVAICVAMSGPSVLYGKMQPYLTEIELHEHMFVQGPPNCSKDVLHICGSIVGKSVNELIMNNETPVVGVYLGDERWGFEDISTGLDAFVDSFVHSLSREQPAYLMGFILLDEWRYVTVKKYYLIHYVTDERQKAKLFFPENPLAIYQSVFFSSEKAAFFYQNGGTVYDGDPMGDANVQAVINDLDRLIFTAEKRSDWLSVHRHLLLKCLMRQKLPINSDELENEDLNMTEYIDSKGLDHVTEAWFMMQSVAALAEYVASLASSLGDVLPLFLESESYKTKIEQMLKNLEPPPPTEIDKKKKKKIVEPPKPNVKKLPKEYMDEFKFTVDEAIYGKMTMIFKTKLLEVCQARIFMTSSSFADYMESKINSCVEEDRRLQNIYPIQDTETIHCLDEIKSMFKALQDILAADVHLICPEAVKFFNNVSPERKEELISSKPLVKPPAKSSKSPLTFGDIEAKKQDVGIVKYRTTVSAGAKSDTFSEPFRDLSPEGYFYEESDEEEDKKKKKKEKKRKKNITEPRVLLLTPVGE